eukprot:6188944-Pleurochrysis_carterae.AAC.2
MVVSKERLEAVPNCSSGCVAQVADLEILGRKVVKAQHVAKTNRRRSRRTGRSQCTCRSRSILSLSRLLCRWFAARAT